MTNPQSFHYLISLLHLVLLFHLNFLLCKWLRTYYNYDIRGITSFGAIILIHNIKINQTIRLIKHYPLHSVFHPYIVIGIIILFNCIAQFCLKIEFIKVEVDQQYLNGQMRNRHCYFFFFRFLDLARLGNRSYLTNGCT